MKLDSNQLSELIHLMITVKADRLGCDGCFDLMDQFAQAQLDQAHLSTSLIAVGEHLEHCKCCRDEYAALLTALRTINE